MRWYLRYGLSYRDVEELLAERGITVDHVTIYRWVQRFTPELIYAARPSRHVAGTAGWTAHLLHAAHPDAPLLIGGRDLAKAQESAAEVGGAEGVVLDLIADDLGLRERPVSAVAVFLRGERIAGLRFAQARGVPHISIWGLDEIAPEVASMHAPDAAPVALGAEWLLGAMTDTTLEFTKQFGRVHHITRRTTTRRPMPFLRRSPRWATRCPPSPDACTMRPTGSRSSPRRSLSSKRVVAGGR